MTLLLCNPVLGLTALSLGGTDFSNPIIITIYIM